MHYGIVEKERLSCSVYHVYATICSVSGNFRVHCTVNTIYCWDFEQHYKMADSLWSALYSGRGNSSNTASASFWMPILFKAGRNLWMRDQWASDAFLCREIALLLLQVLWNASGYLVRALPESYLARVSGGGWVFFVNILVTDGFQRWLKQTVSTSPSNWLHRLSWQMQSWIMNYIFEIPENMSPAVVCEAKKSVIKKSIFSSHWKGFLKPWDIPQCHHTLFFSCALSLSFPLSLSPSLSLSHSPYCTCSQAYMCLPEGCPWIKK